MAWAFATLGRLDEKLFATLARAVEQRLGALNAQELTSTA